MQSRTFFILLLAGSLATSAFCFSESDPEEQRHADFLAAYNGQTALKRVDAIRKLDHSKDQRSLETLYSVSWRDPDPEVRSRAFFALVHSEDPYGYTAYLAADSFKLETEPGVKVEKAVALSSLRYKWSALNELVGFLHSLRWNPWQWNSYGNNGGYVAAGNPPNSESPGETSKPTVARGGYEEWQHREPLRWRSEEELIGIITQTINRMSGTQMEARPRIDQEIVKWWERKSDLWADYDLKIRSKMLAKSQEIKFKDLKDIRADDIQPAKDTARDMVSKSIVPANEAKPVTPNKAALSGPADE